MHIHILVAILQQNATKILSITNSCRNVIRFIIPCRIVMTHYNFFIANNLSNRSTRTGPLTHSCSPWFLLLCAGYSFWGL